MNSAPKPYHRLSPSASEERTPGHRWPVLIGGVLIAIACVAAYSNSLTTPFLFDDGASILENPTIRSLTPLSRVLSPPGDGRTVQGRPFLNLSLALSYAISGERTWGYHLVNLVIHMAAALALFGLVRRTLLLPVAGPRAPNTAAALGTGAALLWSLHPLQTAAVTYTVQRAESLYGLLFLAALYFFLRGATASRPARWHILALLSCLAGMATKEMMVTAPLMILLYDRMFLSPSFGTALRSRRGLYAGLAVTWVFLAALVIHTGNRAGTAGFDSGVSPWHYAMTQFWSICAYLRLVFWPRTLIFDYGTQIAKSASDIIPYAAIVIVLLSATILALRRLPWAGFLGAWFFITLAPSSTFIPSANQTTAEHRMYVPLAAVIVLLVLGTYGIGMRLLARSNLPLPRRGPRGWALGVSSVLVLSVLLGGLTFNRNKDYRSVLSIWQDTIDKRPGNARAYNNRGATYELQGDLDRALADFTRAAEMKPDYETAYYNRGNVYLKRNDFDRAIREYDTALSLKPDYAKALVNRGFALGAKGNYERAIRDFDAAIAAAPGLPGAYNNRSAAYCAIGEYRKAWSDVEMCRRLGGTPNPGLVAAIEQAMRRQ